MVDRLPDGQSMPSRPVAVVALTPAESKRLIAKGVAALPAVRRALERGRVIISTGTTNARVVEEILGQQTDPERYVAGLIVPSGLAVLPVERRLKMTVLVDGRPVAASMEEVLSQFTADDVYIKGANAVDPSGAVGILVAGNTGGTGAGRAYPLVQARGAHFVVPVGLEKLVPSVAEAARHAGIGRTVFSTGKPAGLAPVAGATVVTEIETLRLLFDVTAYHISSGGVQGAEGTVVLALEGPPEKLERAFGLVKEIKARGG